MQNRWEWAGGEQLKFGFGHRFVFVFLGKLRSGNPNNADGSQGRSDWAGRLDTDGQKRTHFDSGGSIGGIQVTNQKFMAATNIVHLLVGPGTGTWDKTSKTQTSQQVLGRITFLKTYKDQNDRPQNQDRLPFATVIATRVCM